MTQLAPFVRWRQFTANGLVLVGGKLYTYAAGTSTPLATYTDYSGFAENPNPVVLDANGEADVWLGQLSYKFVLTDANDVVQWEEDNILGDQSSIFGTLSSTIGSISGTLNNVSGNLSNVSAGLFNVSGNLSNVSSNLLSVSSNLSLVSSNLSDVSSVLAAVSSAVGGGGGGGGLTPFSGVAGRVSAITNAVLTSFEYTVTYTVKYPTAGYYYGVFVGGAVSRFNDSSVTEFLANTFGSVVGGASVYPWLLHGIGPDMFWSPTSHSIVGPFGIDNGLDGAGLAAFNADTSKVYIGFSSFDVIVTDDWVAGGGGGGE